MCTPSNITHEYTQPAACSYRPRPIATYANLLLSSFTYFHFLILDHSARSDVIFLVMNKIFGLCGSFMCVLHVFLRRSVKRIYVSVNSCSHLGHVRLRADPALPAGVVRWTNKMP